MLKFLISNWQLGDCAAAHLWSDRIQIFQFYYCYFEKLTLDVHFIPVMHRVEHGVIFWMLNVVVS